MQSDLLVFFLDSGQHVRCRGVQAVIAGIPLVGCVFCVFDRLGNFIAARDGLDLALALHDVQERIVIAHVVGNFRPPSAVGRGHHFREHSRWSRHFMSSF